MRRRKQGHSFFKVLINDFRTKLLLPPAFSRTYGGILREGLVKLRSSSGRTWDVRLEITEGNKYHFTRGWSRFVEDARLKVGEFLVFSVVEESVLDVDIYGVTCYLREIPPDISSDEDSEDIVVPEAKYILRYPKLRDVGGASTSHGKSLKPSNRLTYFEAHEEAKYIVQRYPKITNVGGASTSHGESLESHNRAPHFEIQLKYFHRYRVMIPKGFYTAAGLRGRRTVPVAYLPKGRYYSIEIRHRVKNRTIDLTEGWSDFRKSNGLILGRHYSFVFVPKKNVIHVQELKKKSK